VNNRGQMRFMCFKGALNAGLFIVFLSRLIKLASPGFVGHMGLRRRGGRRTFCWCPVVR
jgi:hypothetical protein